MFPARSALADIETRFDPARRPVLVAAVALALAAPLGTLAGGCESAPGDEPEQGAAIGAGVGGLAGAAVAGSGDRVEGAIIGALIGAGGGYLVGAHLDKKEEEARRAADEARADPATADDVQRAATADLDSNGFVTIDEVIAMERAGLSDAQMIDRLRGTGQVFELSAENRDTLRQSGVSDSVIEEMPRLNRETLSRSEQQGDRRPR